MKSLRGESLVYIRTRQQVADTRLAVTGHSAAARSFCLPRCCIRYEYFHGMFSLRGREWMYGTKHELTMTLVGGSISSLLIVRDVVKQDFSNRLICQEDKKSAPESPLVENRVSAASRSRVSVARAWGDPAAWERRLKGGRAAA